MWAPQHKTYRSHKGAVGFENKQCDSTFAGYHCSNLQGMRIAGLWALSFPCRDPWQVPMIDPLSFEFRHGLRSLLNTVFHETTIDCSESENKWKIICKQLFGKHHESIVLLSLLIRKKYFWERRSKTHSEGYHCSPVQGGKRTWIFILTPFIQAMSRPFFPSFLLLVPRHHKTHRANSSSRLFN